MCGSLQAGHDSCLHYRGEGKSLVNGGIDVRLAHGLPGKPEEEHLLTTPFMSQQGGDTVKSASCSVVSNSLRPQGLYSPWNSPGQNTGVRSHSLLQGIFPTQGSNPGLPPCRQILYQLSYWGSPRILEWVAYFFSSGSPQPRNRKGISCIPGRFFTN